MAESQKGKDAGSGRAKRRRKASENVQEQPQPETSSKAKVPRKKGRGTAVADKKKLSEQPAPSEPSGREGGEEPLSSVGDERKDASERGGDGPGNEPMPAVKLKYGRGTSMYSHIGSFRKRSLAKALGDTEWERLIRWRKEENYKRIEHPTRLDKARALGYKAKQGVVLVRVRVRRGGLRKRRIAKGRRAKRKGILRITMKKNTQRMAEERVARRYPNMEVLNSYQVAQDGMRKWYEVILVDPYNPSVLSDRNLSWISNQAHSGRAYRGLTSAGKMGRGLRWKGKGAEKVRPSIRANDRKGK